MAIFDYHGDNKCAYESPTKTCMKQSTYNKTLVILGYMFGVIFTIEAVIKIFAYGAFNGKKTYFKSHWNVLDFVIVVFGLMEML